MSKVDKTLEKWKNSKQPVPLSEVEAVIRRYFPDTKIKGGTSHRFMISHPALIGVPHFAPNGTFLIPVKGRTVKPFYIKQLIEAITLLQEYNNNNEKIS